jgi:hypothetical protein
MRNGSVVDFHSLEVHEQHQVLESNSLLSLLLNALRCDRHPEFTLSVHLTFNEGQLQNTIFYCCEPCRKEIELALLASTFPASSHCLRKGQRRKMQLSA